MSNWARNNNGQPKWTMETRMKMAEMYQLLRERVDRDHQYVKDIFFYSYSYSYYIY